MRTFQDAFFMTFSNEILEKNFPGTNFLGAIIQGVTFQEAIFRG